MTKNIERRRSSKNERNSRGYITPSVDPMGGRGFRVNVSLRNEEN